MSLAPLSHGETQTSPLRQNDQETRKAVGLFSRSYLSFLDLPQPILRHIYCEAGVIQGQSIKLRRRGVWLPGRDRVNLSTTLNLLLTCRAIYAEVSFIVFSENRITVENDYSHNLQPLRNLTANSLSALTNLTIYLHASCDYPACNYYDPYADNTHDHINPLQPSSSKFQKILSEWQCTVNHIAVHIQPSRLQLKFICDIEEDLEAATSILEPFNCFPTLATCSIRLSQRYKPGIQHLVRRTAMRAMNVIPHEPKAPFRFLDLPQELRRLVLEYTDLVTPNCEVVWRPAVGFYLQYLWWGCGKECDLFPESHYACQFRRCWTSNKLQFCHRYRSAFCPDCKCWSPPTSLFLICRSMMEDVWSVFFMENRFVISSSKGFLKGPNPPPDYLDVSTFLTSVVPRNALRFLTFLEVVFPPFDDSYMGLNGAGYQSWLEVINFINDSLCLPILTLRICVANPWFPSSETGSVLNSMTVERLKKITAAYLQIVHPLSKIDGSRKLFVDATWARQWHPEWSKTYGRRTSHRLERYTTAIHQGLNRAMNGIYYDCGSLRKSGQPISQWLQKAMADPIILQPSYYVPMQHHLGRTEPVDAIRYDYDEI